MGSCSLLQGSSEPRSPTLKVDSLPTELSGKPPGGSVGKESACNAGEHGLIPGSGRSAGEGNSCPLQYSWASLVAQLVKNPSAVQETWARSLGWEGPLKKGTAPRSSILAWRIHGRYSPQGRGESDTTEQLSVSPSFIH